MPAEIANPANDLYLPFVSGGTGKATPVVLPHFTGLGVGIPHQLKQIGPCTSQEGGSLSVYGDVYGRILADLIPNWWYTWLFDAMGTPGNAPMLWRQKWNKHAEEAFVVADQYKSHDLTWLIGNEPLVEGQATVTPAEAAGLTQLWRRELPTVKFACPGVYINHLRAIDFLDAYLDAGGPVPDFWHVHNYAYGIRGAEFANNRFFMWMKRRNVIRPVIISETNLWDDDDWGAQIPMMDWIVDLLEGENPVVAVAWFAAWYKFWGARLLLNDECERNELGDYFRSLTVEGVEVKYSDSVDEGLSSGV